MYLSLIGVLVAMLAWNAGLARIGALNAMLLLCLFPVITFAVRYAQGQRFTALELGGAAPGQCTEPGMELLPGEWLR